MRRQQLTQAQITALLDPPTDQRELVRHYTLSAADLGAIRRCRGDHNRLGHALMLCYLRYPGRPLKAGERPPRPLLLFIAEQIDALPESIEDYLAAERNRQRHVAELQDRLGFRPFGTRPAADLAGWLLPHAIENDRLVHLAGLVVEECRRRRIVVPSPSALERLCVQARYQARGEVQRRLTDGLSTDQRRRLDVLTQRRAETNQGLVRRGCDGSLPVALLFRAGLRLRRQARTSRARQSAVAGGSVGQGGQGLARVPAEHPGVGHASRQLAGRRQHGQAVCGEAQPVSLRC